MTPLELIEARIETRTAMRDAYEMFSAQWSIHNEVLEELEFIKRALK